MKALRSPDRIDPTRTAGLRQEMQAQLKRRFRRFRLEVIRKILDEDALGLAPEPVNPFMSAIGNIDSGWDWVVANCGGVGSGVPGPCPGGKVAGAVGKSVAIAKAVGAKAGHLEHVAQEWVSTKVQDNLAKLPEGVQTAVAATWTVAKTIGAVAFAGWSTSQALAKEISLQKGATEEQAETLRNTLKTVDILSFKPLSLGLPFLGPAGTVANAALWVVPPATAGYLAFNTVRHPVKTALAATSLVKKAWAGFNAKFVQTLADATPGEGQRPGLACATLIADQLEKHNYDQWWVALFVMAMNQTGTIPLAIMVANDVYAKEPMPEIVPEPDDNARFFGKRALALLGDNPTANTVWKYRPNPEKVDEFKKWLRQQHELWLKGTYGSAWQQHMKSTDDELWMEYIRAGYAKGAGRAFDDATKTERALASGKGELDFYNGTREQFLRSSFGQPESIEKVKLLAGRSFDDLENITTDMSTRMTRQLVDGLIKGQGPRELATALAKEVDIGEERALVVARTELIRAHAEGQLTALEQLGVEEVGVAVEWSTSMDERVCELCEPLEGVVLKIDEARGMLPRHPNCRCAWVPANVGEDDPQKDTKGAIDKAVKSSQTRAGDDDDWEPGSTIRSDRPRSMVGNRILAAFSRLLHGRTDDTSR